MKLYKFRSLGSCEQAKRATEIVTTGKFWCSKLWELNDPMEGVYSHQPGALEPDEIQMLFGEKNKHVLCAFSEKKAFGCPTMWGYYANGFRGVAIEVDMDEGPKLRKITYQPSMADWNRLDDHHSNSDWLKEVMTTKLSDWEHEYEYRYLKSINLPPKKKGQECKIGKIKAVHFGLPYRNAGNRQEVFSRSNQIRDYYKRAAMLANVAEAKGLKCCGVKIKEGKVVSEPLKSVDIDKLLQECNQ